MACTSKHDDAETGTAGEVFGAFLKLGCTSFGGPIAHLGYFRDELVARRRWLDDHAYAELVGLCQFLPGPASSQAGFALGLMRAGPLGGLAAWTAFTLPSAILMFGFALVAADLSGPLAAAAIHGLKIAAVAVVAQALVGMARTLTPDLPRLSLAAAAMVAMLIAAAPAAQIAVILVGALAGVGFGKAGKVELQAPIGWAPRRRTGFACLALFAGLLSLLPLASSWQGSFALADIFYRAGALVFGGGHVVLPLLREGLVPGWMNDGQFLAGYGAAQAVPGPLFTLSAYLGALAEPDAPVAGALTALTMIFLPGLLLTAGAMPFRAAIAQSATARAAISGVNAAVVGILAAALYDPLWTSGILSPPDAMIAIAGFGLLVRLQVPPLAVVLGSVAASIGAAVLAGP
ncbi:chromate transporter [Sphingopyxis italica]|uniref:Chromate transporter n=1 Tax=Sphingopyxis italica TaxID=1129133 RepID=A0A7X6B9N6_9SPHN|nr:chromate efflux transporter [Sphingopyxis italica]NJB89987.1 chromate transporter [Sphingopyxis italica]